MSAKAPLTMPAPEYWDIRSQARMREYLRGARSTTSTMQRAYNNAQKRIEQQIMELLNRYANRYGLDPAQAKAILNERITESQLEKLRELYDSASDAAKAKLGCRLNAESFRYRITNLENLRESVNLTCAEMADIQIKKTKERLIDTAKDAYDRVECDIQKGLGVGWQTSGISKRKIDQILREDWSGRHYSERIWTDVRKVSRLLQDGMLEALMSGKGYTQIAEQIALTMDVGLRSAERLVATEVCYVANASELERYRAEGIKMYLYIAILDNRTSELCASHDGKVYPVSEARIGKNFPPLHPWCRSSTGPALSQAWVDSLVRVIQDPETGDYVRLTPSMGYQFWRDKFAKKRP